MNDRFRSRQIALCAVLASAGCFNPEDPASDASTSTSVPGPTDGSVSGGPSTTVVQEASTTGDEETTRSETGIPTSSDAGTGGASESSSTSSGTQTGEGSASGGESESTMSSGGDSETGDADDCDPDPCQNGECRDAWQAFECTCAANWGGPTCDQRLFEGLGRLPDSEHSVATGINDIGTIVVGWSGNDSGLYDFAPFVYREGALSALTMLGSGGAARAVNLDGTVIVGTMFFEGILRGARWNRFDDVFTLDGTGSDEPVSIAATSRDGSVIVGTCEPGGFRKACLWRHFDPEPELLPAPEAYAGADSFALDVSADGLTVLGYTQSPDAVFLWSEESGWQEPTGWQDLAGGVLSADGSAFVASDRDGRVVRSIEGGPPTSLGFSGTPRDLSADGTVIVGSSGEGGATHWTEALGARALSEVLLEAGADLEGWTLTEATAVSRDGRVLAGTGTHEGHREAWIARLP